MAKRLYIAILIMAAATAWPAASGNRANPFSAGSAWAAAASPDIEWFKEDMTVSPKYLPEEEGVFGMSWAHFLTMTFLVLFFLGTLILFYIRSKRTEEILTTLLKEEEHHGSQS